MVGRVVIVTSNSETAADFRQLGLHIVHEKSATGDGLNAAIELGRAWAARHHPHEPVAVLPADLPALTPAALDEVLVEALQHELAFCSDAHGIGTTVLTAAEPRALSPAYGGYSAEAHRALGAVQLNGVDQRARRDIAAIADLAEAHPLGLGHHTTAVLRKFSVDLSVEIFAPLGDSTHSTTAM